ncbi:MAG TPA: hypothetical protein VHM90_22125, partial [Phycisphaerae bacterium]|nr:hypothetical protein [Phycisphaerae bacterium]
LRAESQKITAAKPELRDAEKEVTLLGRSTLLAAEIARDYAALDAVWTTWAVDHMKPYGIDDREKAAYTAQAARWKEFVNLQKEEAAQNALAEEAAQERKLLVLKAAAGLDEKVANLRGKETEARSKASLAATKQAADYWEAQFEKIKDPKPDDIWARNVTAQRDLTLAKRAEGDAGVAFGRAQQTLNADDPHLKELRAAWLLAGLKAMRSESTLNLLSVDFEISKREGLGANDPDLPALKKERESLLQKIKDLDEAIGKP